MDRPHLLVGLPVTVRTLAEVVVEAERISGSKSLVDWYDESGR